MALPKREKIITVEKNLRLIDVFMTETSHRASIYDGTTRLYEGYSTSREGAGKKAMKWLKDNYIIVRERWVA